MRSFVLRTLTLAPLLAAAWIDPTSSPAQAQTSPAAFDDYEALFSRVLRRPGDPALNKEFAREAETRGDLRHAFASLERVVLSSPGDTEAQAEFDRLRNKLMPAVTKVTVEVGANYASNPRQLPHRARVVAQLPDNLVDPFSVSVPRPDDATFDAGIAVADERTIAGLRWRTLALAQGQFQADIATLDSPALAVESGPVFQITPDLWMHVAGGAAIAWLDDEKLYDDALVSVTLGGLYRGLTQTVTARYTWRDGNFGVGEVLNDDGVVFADRKANNAQIFDLEGRLVVSPSLAKGDLLYLRPRLQVSQNDGDPTGSAGEFFSFQRPLFPSDFTEAGGAVAYHCPLFGGRAFLGAGIAVYQRWYDEGAATVLSFKEESVVSVSPGKRRDTYIEPTAHLILPNLLGPNLDLRFDYRFEHNDSNATTTMLKGSDIAEFPADFENHVAGVRVVGRF